MAQFSETFNVMIAALASAGAQKFELEDVNKESMQTTAIISADHVLLFEAVDHPKFADVSQCRIYTYPKTESSIGRIVRAHDLIFQTRSHFWKNYPGYLAFVTALSEIAPEAQISSASYTLKDEVVLEPHKKEPIKQ